MNLEIELVIPQLQREESPIRQEPPALLVPSFAMELAGRHRLTKVEAREFTKTFYEGDLIGTATMLARLAFVTAGTCVTLGCLPQFEHFAEAVKESVENQANELAEAIKKSDWHRIRVCSCKLELIWYGIAANMGLPYGDIVTYLAGQYAKNDGPDRKAMAALLRKAGMTVEEAA